MNDFFTRQEDARRQSGRLLLLFGLAVSFVVFAVYLLATSLYLLNNWREGAAGFWHPDLFFLTTSVTLLFITAASLWKTQELRQGGSVVATALGAKPVPLQSQDPHERRLRNVVEEMSIAAGIPVPDLYLLDRERGINGFAAGHDVHNAAVCLTRGAVELLDRDELQGVVAHEFSHILNGDMLLNIRFLGWLNGILVISQTGKLLLRSARVGRGRATGGLLVIATALYLIGYVGYFFGQLIKSAVSRQRELLGDACAVQFTRNPPGLAGALKKIGGLARGSLLDHPRAVEVSHMCFGSGIAEPWLAALDSHPPLKERILRLDPRFDGIYPQVQPLPAPQAAPYLLKRVPTARPSDAPLSGAAVLAMLEAVGEPMQEHVDLARRLLAGLPETLRAATRTPLGACAVVCALLTDQDAEVRARQEQTVRERLGPDVAAHTRQLLGDILVLPPRVRLPLLDLSLPALRTLEHGQYLKFKAATAALAAADGKLSLFEFALRYIMLRHLEPSFVQAPPRPVQIYGIRGVERACSCVLSRLARIGHSGESEAGEAFARGAAVLGEPKATFDFLPAGECGAAAMENSFAKLEVISPLLKRRLLAACLECISHDEKVTQSEAEIFRAIADAVGCPVPPWLVLMGDSQEREPKSPA